METEPATTKRENEAPLRHLSRSLPLWICSDNMDSFRSELIGISPSRLHCKAPKYIEPFSKLIVTFDLPFVSGDSVTVECEGIVVRVEPAVNIPGIPEHRLAIDLCDMDRETAHLLVDFIEAPDAVSFLCQRLNGEGSNG